MKIALTLLFVVVFVALFSFSCANKSDGMDGDDDSMFSKEKKLCHRGCKVECDSKNFDKKDERRECMKSCRQECKNPAKSEQFVQIAKELVKKPTPTAATIRPLALCRKNCEATCPANDRVCRSDCKLVCQERGDAVPPSEEEFSALRKRLVKSPVQALKSELTACRRNCISSCAAENEPRACAKECKRNNCGDLKEKFQSKKREVTQK
eukprot:TRINITY_DN1435_c0_g1_i1.p1 TRINITY_DN1435_c0_g1~~TRINITY_DN1435_c0_g1_i1.p1  ORF type:complete len:209 (-),score=78.83 TRINITY_DN1435_c0_g1_i1:31-657(-)